MKRFQLIRPKSLTDPVYEDYEYLIRWIGRDGSDYVYMFYDAEVETKIRSEVVNELDSTRVESLIESEGKSVMLTADDLSLSDLQLVGQIMSNKSVTRLLKDGTTERYAPDEGSFKYRLRDGRYNIELTLIAANVKVWR